jgi:uncharacterized protein YggE
MLLVGHTLTAKGRIAALENALQRARFFAAGAGRPLGFLHVQQAIEEGAAPAPAGPRRSPPRPRRETAATPPPLTHGRIAEEIGAVRMAL